MLENLVIADTSCLILLSKVDELDILRANYRRILITPEIAEEFNQDIPDWIEVVETKDKQLQRLLEDSLDLGESTALTLSFETENSTVILDDLKARKIAVKLGLKVTGTIGVVIKAKLNGTIPSAKTILIKFQTLTFVSIRS